MDIKRFFKSMKVALTSPHAFCNVFFSLSICLTAHQTPSDLSPASFSFSIFYYIFYSHCDNCAFLLLNVLQAYVLDSHFSVSVLCHLMIFSLWINHSVPHIVLQLKCCASSVSKHECDPISITMKQDVKWSSCNQIKHGLQGTTFVF